MPYNELVKNFSRIRGYMREFYLYGFKSREEYTQKSARSYDDERRRLESWLGDHMRFHRTSDGKNVFLSIDSRLSHHNPLYKAWKTKSFTDGDITLHFLLFDILNDPTRSLTLAEITDRIDRSLAQFSNPKMFDESTVRKKMKEYVEEGLIIAEKTGKTVRYRRTESMELPDSDMLDFFSETAPCGVIGSFLLDRKKQNRHEEHFAFKHHYITSAMDSEILCSLFLAIREKRSVTLECGGKQKVIPIRIMISVQSGRQYLMAYTPKFRRITPFRTDHIVSVKPGEVSERFDELQEILDRMLPHMWGVSTQSWSGTHIERVEFTIRYTNEERHIPRRLEREKRCGTVEHLDANTSRFTAEVFDASEMIPWIRTFLCRIVDIQFSNKELEAQFHSDLKKMYAMYGLEGGDDDAFQ